MTVTRPVPAVLAVLSALAVLAALALLAVGVAALVGVRVPLVLGLPRAHAALVLDDLAQLAAAAFAALTCAGAARRTSGRRRQAWTALALGCACWAAGQAVWTWYEVALGRETPFPSPADVGYLGFPVGATAALLLYPTQGTPADHGRRLLDGLVAALSLGLVSWTTTLDAVLADHTLDGLPWVIATAYPTADVAVLTMVVLLLSRATTDRLALVLVGSGVAAVALADSAFLLLTASGSYSSSQHLVALGWCLGFGLVGAAGLVAVSAAPAQDDARSDRGGRAGLLPYVPLLVAGVVLGGEAYAGAPPGRVEVTAVALLVAAVLARQYGLLRDHGRLVAQLAVRGAELRAQAFTDGLTGLDNRAHFLRRLDDALAGHRRGLRTVAVLFCDLDDFKLVNDTLGHATGDRLLVQVAERLRAVLRSGDVLARLGGDEFAVLLEDDGEPAVVGRRVVRCLDEPFRVGEHVLRVGASVGTTTVALGLPTPSADALLAQADTAMYTAKRGGKGASRSFRPGMELPEVAEAGLAAALGRAVEDRELELHYRPVVHLRSGLLVGVEALAHWRREGQLVAPPAYVPLAERTGLIRPLTTLVLDLACAQAADWAARGLHPGLRVGLDLSPQSVTDRTLPGRVAACLDRHGLHGGSLVVEITETGVLTDPAAAAAVCAALHELGVLLTLDDFGVGSASLSHLQLLPLHAVKLDRSLLDGLGRDHRRTVLVRAVLRLLADLGLDAIAEGVDRPEQLEALHELGCTFAQGHLLGRPAPGDGALSGALALDPAGLLRPAGPVRG